MMKLYVFEGTVEEISKVVHTMQPTTAASTMSVEVPEEEVSSPPRPPKETSAESKFVTLDCARRILARRPLSGPLKAMLKAINEAHPEWVSSDDLYAATDYTPRQFSGLMGAFGRRKYYTSGFEAERDAQFFDCRRRDGDGPWEYRLPGTVREALREENLGMTVAAERETGEG